MARGDLPAADWQQLEAVIRRAGRLVEPSDELRPKVLEAARERTARRRTRQQVLATAAAILVTMAASLPGHWLASNSGVRSWGYVAAVEVQQHAVRRSLAMNVDPIWALIEVFRDQRQHQAWRLAQEAEQ